MSLQKVDKSQILVEGIDGQAFARSGIEADSNLTVERSPLGGIGVFYEGDAADEKVLVRIPHHMLLDCRKLTEMQLELKESEPENADIVKAVLSCCLGVSETEIVIAYMFGFRIVLSTAQLKTLEKITFYLELLENTEIDMLSEETTDNYFLEQEATGRNRLREKYQQIKENLLGEDPIAIPTFEDYLHLNKVIKSRVLEIPHALDDGSDDFEVSTTLVPFMDFANHDEDNNAIFDVDRTTNDVILKYTHPGGKKEVVIKYNDVVSIQQFVSVYGFVPRAQYELFEIKLSAEELNIVINKISETCDVPYDKIMKWLEILPTIQLIKTKSKVFINYNCNPVPLWGIFSDKFRFLDWRSNIDTEKINDDDLLQSSKEELIALVEFQENVCTVIQGIDKTVGVAPADICESQEQDCISKLNTLVKMVAQMRIKPVASTGLTAAYLTYEQELYKQIQAQDDFELEPQNLNPQWNDSSRIRPLVIYDYL